MADRELVINLRFVKAAAEQQARQFHDGERGRIKQTSDEQEKSDKAYIRAIKMKVRAVEQFAREVDRRAKDRDRADERSEQAYVRAVKRKLAAEKQLADAVARGARAEGRERERSEQEYVRAMKRKAAALNAFAREAERRVREREKAESDSQKRLDRGDDDFRKAELRRLRRSIEARMQAGQQAEAMERRFARSWADEWDRAERSLSSRRMRRLREEEQARRRLRRMEATALEDGRRRAEANESASGGMPYGPGQSISTARQLSSRKGLAALGDDAAGFRAELDRAVERSIGRSDRTMRRKFASDDLGQYREMSGRSGRLGRDQARREERLEDERDVEHGRQMARKRLEYHADGARKEAELAREAIGKSQAYRAQAVEAEGKGQKHRAAGYRRLAEVEASSAKFAADESTRHSKRAAEEQGVVVRGQGNALRKHYKSTVDSAKEAADGATRLVKRGNAEIEASAKKSGDVQKDAIKGVGSALDRQQKQIISVSQAYTTMRIGAEIAQAFRLAMDAVNESMKNARDHIAGMVAETGQLRREMAEIHAMGGKPQTDASTAEELKIYERAAVTPQQGIAAQKEFLAQAANQIEPANMGPGQDRSAYRMTREQAAELMEFSMAQAAAQGIEPGPASLLMSTITAKADVDKEGKIDVAKVKDQFARNMGLFRNERGHTAQDVRQFAEAAQKNARNAGDLDRMAVMHSAQTEIGPGKSRVHLDALLRGMDQFKDEQRDELGIAPGMTDDQALAAATEAIPRLAAAEGQDERRVARRFFNDQRELDAFMAHLNQGVRGGTYARAAAEQKAGGTAQAQADIDRHGKSQTGIESAQQSGTARARAERAAVYRRLTEQRGDAAIVTIRAAEVEEPEGFVNAIQTRAGQQFGGRGNLFEDETERITIKRINEGLANFDEGVDWLEKNGTLTTNSPEPLKARAANLLHDLRQRGNARGPRPGRIPGRTRVGDAARNMLDQSYKPAVEFPDRMNVVLPHDLMGGLRVGRGGYGRRGTTRERLDRIAVGRHQGLRGVRPGGAGRPAAPGAAPDPAAAAHIEANRRYLQDRRAAMRVGRTAPPRPEFPDYRPRSLIGTSPDMQKYREYARGAQAAARRDAEERMAANTGPRQPRPIVTGPSRAELDAAGHAASLPGAEWGQRMMRPGAEWGQRMIRSGWDRFSNFFSSHARGDYATRGDEGTNNLKAMGGAIRRAIRGDVPPALPGRPPYQRN